MSQNSLDFECMQLQVVSRLFWGLFHVLVFMSFIFVIGSCCLCHAPLALLYSYYWFLYSMCHVLIGCLSHVSCSSLVGSCHVSLILCYK